MYLLQKIEQNVCFLSFTLSKTTNALLVICQFYPDFFPRLACIAKRPVILKKIFFDECQSCANLLI